MADIDLLDIFGIQTETDAEFVIREIEEEFIKLEKRIRKRLKKVVPLVTEELIRQAVLLGTLLEDAFRVESMEDYARGASIYGEELAGSLYELQQELYGLQTAVIRAAAPLVEVFLPVVRAAVSALTSLAESIAYVLRLLLFGSDKAEDFADNLNSTNSAGNRLKKTLAGFDEITRLGDRDSLTENFPVEAPEELTGIYAEFADTLLKLFEPLKEIDFTAAAESLERLTAALEPITMELFSALEWAWYNIFVPLAQWTAEELLPVFLDGLTNSLQALGIIIDALKPSFLWLFENYLKPLAKWKGDEIIKSLREFILNLDGANNSLGGLLTPVSNWISAGKILINTLAEMCEQTFRVSTVTQWANGYVTELVQTFLFSRGHFSGTNSALGTLLGIFGELGAVFGEISLDSEKNMEIMKTIWGDSWTYLEDNVTEPATKSVENMSNAMSSTVNALCTSVMTALGVTGSAIAGLSGTIFGTDVSVSRVRSVPHLAKGAVLPANRPFMAMVGDQRHGTNIEAPLATIQEAVALVMEEYAAANMAGHEATVGVLKELLSAVLGIHIGDETIASAVSRYDRKMAVVTGGYV